MKHNKEEQLDNFIRSRLAVPGTSRNDIQPSGGFTRRVMRQIGLVERRRRWHGYLLAVVLSMAPLAVREVWLVVRGDYFSASSLPMGRLIVAGYRFLLSPAALYILVALGVLAFLMRANKLRRNYSSSFIRVA